MPGLLLCRTAPPKKPICVVSNFYPSQGRAGDRCGFEGNATDLFDSLDLHEVLRSLVDSSETVEVNGFHGTEAFLCTLVLTGVDAVSVQGVLKTDIIRIKTTPPGQRTTPR